MTTVYKLNPYTGQFDAVSDPAIAEELKQNIQENFNQIRNIEENLNNRVELLEFNNIDNIEINLNQFGVRPSVEVWVVNQYGTHVECFPDIQFTETKIIVDFHDNYESGYLVLKQ